MDGYVNARIQPHVSGYLIKQNYREGSFVHNGDVLFEIDPRTRGHLPAGAQLLRKPFTTETLLQAVNVAIAPPVADTVH